MKNDTVFIAFPHSPQPYQVSALDLYTLIRRGAHLTNCALAMQPSDREQYTALTGRLLQQWLEAEMAAR